MMLQKQVLTQSKQLEKKLQHPKKCCTLYTKKKSQKRTIIIMDVIGDWCGEKIVLFLLKINKLSKFENDYMHKKSGK